jgi:hypothetical protein
MLQLKGLMKLFAKTAQMGNQRILLFIFGLESVRYLLVLVIIAVVFEHPPIIGLLLIIAKSAILLDDYHEELDGLSALLSVIAEVQQRWSVI